MASLMFAFFSRDENREYFLIRERSDVMFFHLEKKKTTVVTDWTGSIVHFYFFKSQLVSFNINILF